jgi:hypothetical protein
MSIEHSSAKQVSKYFCSIPRVSARYNYEIHHNGIIYTDNKLYSSFGLTYEHYLIELLETIKYKEKGCGSERINFIKKSQHYITKSYYTSHTDDMGRHRNDVLYTKIKPIIYDLSN